MWIGHPHMVGWRLAVLNAVVVPFAREYRDFHRPSLRIPTSSSESRAKFSHLRPNSLRLGTGKLFWSIRELNRVIRELIRLISELRDLTVISIYINRVPASF